jgi:hypothetical protein
MHTMSKCYSSMLLMTSRYVVECKRFQLKVPSFLSKRLLFGQILKVGTKNMNGLRLANMHLFAFKN